MRMRQLFFASAVLLVHGTLIAATPVTDFKVEGKQTHFEVDSQGVLVSPECKKAKAAHPCDAMKAARSVTFAVLPSRALKGGMNPGAALCHALKQKVVYGTDAQGNENSFCRFRDGSLIDNGGLSLYAENNAGRQAKVKRAK